MRAHHTVDATHRGSPLSRNQRTTRCGSPHSYEEVITAQVYQLQLVSHRTAQWVREISPTAPTTMLAHPPSSLTLSLLIYMHGRVTSPAGIFRHATSCHHREDKNGLSSLILFSLSTINTYVNGDAKRSVVSALLCAIKSLEIQTESVVITRVQRHI